MSSLDEAIEVAGMSQMPDGKKWPHQARIPNQVLKESTRRLRSAGISGAASFEQLHDLITASAGSVNGIGELYCYDTALRIGAFLGFESETVFLHRGTRAGATALGFDTRLKVIQIEELPAELQTLAAYQLEDVLCIFKDWL